MSDLPSIFNRNSMTSNSTRDLLSIQRRMKEKFDTFPRRRLPLLNSRVLTSVVAALATTITTQSFAQCGGIQRRAPRGSCSSFLRARTRVGTGTPRRIRAS
jgi:hypothetical protein